MPTANHDACAAACETSIATNASSRSSIAAGNASHARKRAARVGVWDWDVRSDQASWTAEAWQIFTGTEPRADGVSQELWLQCVHPDDRERAAEVVRSALVSRRYEDTFRVVHADGSVHWVEAVADAFFACDSSARLVGVARDITATREAALALDAALARSELAVRSRDQLVSLISHDLRGLVHALALDLDLLEQRRPLLADLDPTIHSCLDRMNRQVMAMTRMLAGLLDTALLQAGQPLELDRRPIELGALARRVVAAQRSFTPERQLELRVPTSPVIGHWDAGRLERALANLVSNAVKYSNDRVEIEVEVAEVSAIMRVSDRGIGIPQPDLARVFEWFVRASNANQGATDGTGIGLAAAKQIVGQHGGSISVTSELGRGTTFVVMLPLT